MKLYEPIEAKPHTSPYKIHRYFARRPWNVFSRIIDLYSKKSDIVLDPFCGGGVTVYECLKKGRKIIGLDLNPLSIFIVQNMIKRKGDLDGLEKAYDQIIDYLNYLYFNSKKVEWNEIAFEVECNLCSQLTTLSNDNKIKNGRYSCFNLKCDGNKKNGGYIEPKNCKRTGYKYLSSVIRSPSSNKTEHILYDKQSEKQIQYHINFLQKEIKKNKVSIPHDKIPINWDRQYEDLLYRKGIINFQDFFTKRNLLINILLLDFIKNLDVNNKTKEILRLSFSSSLRDTNIMSFTNVGWQSGKPTTWSKHAYWIPNQFCEVNVLDSFRKAYSRVKASLELNSQINYHVNKIDDFKAFNKGNMLLLSGSIEDANIPENSVDTIITDPPYGSNVQYLELSHFWYPWNKDLYGKDNIDFTKEAVSNRKKNFEGSKGMKEYEDNLFRVFHKCFKVLKPNRLMVLTFNNKDIGAWLALMISIFRAGFEFKKDSLFFQPGIKNYKQTAHTKYEGSPYGDFIYIFQKKINKKNINKKNQSEDEFIKELDEVLLKHIGQNGLKNSNNNQIIKEMILEVIPKVNAFATSIQKDGKHTLYEKYKKNHLDKIYSGKMTRKSETKIIKDVKKYNTLLPQYLQILKSLKSRYELVEDGEFSKLVNFKTNKEEPIHRWFDYKQGYSSLLVKKIIQRESPDKKYYIIDPFSGVGTTNVVAQKMGFKSIGFDINPMATFTAKVKCSDYSKEDISEIKKYTEEFSPQKSTNIPNSTLLEKSFSKDSFNQLMGIKGFFEKIEDQKIKDFFKLVYLSIIEDASNRVKDGNGIKIVKNKKIISDIYNHYKDKVNSFLMDINTFTKLPQSHIINGSLLIDDNFDKIRDKKAGIVIFSPPYANCFDYCEVYKLELWMGDFVKNYDDFRKYRSIAMRSHVNSKFDHTIKNKNKSVNIIADVISCFNIWNKNIPDMIKGYFDDMEDMLIRLKTLMIPKSKCYIVVANSGYRGVLVPTDLLISEIATKIGLNVKEIIYARKIRASSQQMKELHGEYEKLMRESIIILEKDESE